MTVNLEGDNNFQGSQLRAYACHCVYFYIVYSFNIVLRVCPNHVMMKPLKEDAAK